MMRREQIEKALEPFACECDDGCCGYPNEQNMADCISYRAREALAALRDPHAPALVPREEVDEILSERNERIDEWMAGHKELEKEIAALRSAKDEPSEAEVEAAYITWREHEGDMRSSFRAALIAARKAREV